MQFNDVAANNFKTEKETLNNSVTENTSIFNLSAVYSNSNVVIFIRYITCWFFLIQSSYVCCSFEKLFNYIKSILVTL